MEWFEELGSQSRPFSIFQPTEINQKPIMMSLWFFTFLKVSNGENQKLERSWTKHQQQCCIQLYFGTFWTVWMPKKIYKYIFHAKTKWNIACKYLKTKIFSRDTNIPSPNVSNINYVWTISYNNWELLCITKLEMFVISCINTWPSFTFILPRTLKKQSKVQPAKCTHVYDDVKYFEISAFTKNLKI